jgi:hypothetical protein
LRNVDAPHLAQVPIRAAKLEDIRACLSGSSGKIVMVSARQFSVENRN